MSARAGKASKTASRSQTRTCTSKEHSIDCTSPYVISIVNLPRYEGACWEIRLDVPTPAGAGVAAMRVVEGEHLTLNLTLESVKEGVFVHGSVHGRAEGECVRCLREVNCDINESIAEMVYYPESIHALQDEGEENVDELLVIDHDHIDLEPLVRDAAVLALPLQPLCAPDCAGLCPECGQRWSDLPENHHHEYYDSRFSALDALAAQLAEESSSDARQGADVSGSSGVDAGVKQGAESVGCSGAIPDNAGGGVTYKGGEA